MLTHSKLFAKPLGSTRRRVAAKVAFAVVLVVNGLAGSTTILGGVNTADVSDKYANLFAPAGLTFAIWGVIYLLLIGFVAYMWGIIPRAKKSALDLVAADRLLYLFTISSILNVIWIFTWQYQILGLSVLIMAGLVATLILIQRDLSRLKLKDREQLLVKAPFSVYAGWITVAAIANVTTWLVSIGWNGGGISENVWTVIMLLIGATIGITVAVKRHDWMYLAVFVWAYFGIYYKHTTIFEGDHANVIAALTMLIPSLFVLCVFIACWPKATRN